MALLCTHRGTQDSYRIMYYVSGIYMKQERFLTSYDSLSCLGNSSVGFMWPHVDNCIYFFLKLEDFEGPAWCHMSDTWCWVLSKALGFSPYGLSFSTVDWLLYIVVLALIQEDECVSCKAS